MRCRLPTNCLMRSRIVPVPRSAGNGSTPATPSGTALFDGKGAMSTFIGSSTSSSMVRGQRSHGILATTPAATTPVTSTTEHGQTISETWSSANVRPEAKATAKLSSTKPKCERSEQRCRVHTEESATTLPRSTKSAQCASLKSKTDTPGAGSNNPPSTP